jgi:hypothetical protein
LDTNFATAITIGNTAVQLGNTVTTLNNMTLANVTISSGEVTTGNVSVSGNVTLTGGTANAVAYLNSSKVLTTGSALVFDGTNLGLGVTPSAWGSGLKAVELGGSVSYFALNNTSANGFIYWNMWNDGTNNKTKQTGNIAAYGYSSGGAHVWFNGTGTINTTSSLTQAMTLDASGNLGIGTTSPAARLNISGGDAYFYNTANLGGIRIGYDASNYWSIQRENASTGRLGFFNGTSEKVSIDTSGNLLVGTTSLIGSGRINSYNAANNGITSQVGNNSYATFAGYQSSGAVQFYVNATGQIYSTSTSITAISDQRQKENIRDLDTGLTQVLALQPRRFDWKENCGDGKKNNVGFIAQEVEQVLPDIMGTWTDEKANEWKAISTGNMIPTLVKAIQEQQAIITTLTARITALESA